MRYLESFNRRVKLVRKNLSLSTAELAELCDVDERVVLAWESTDPRQRDFPDVSELMDLCVRTETALEALLDLSGIEDEGQLELPGLAFSNGGDLARAVDELEREIQRFQLSDEESEMLRRFRKASAENRRMILQLLGE